MNVYSVLRYCMCESTCIRYFEEIRIRALSELRSISMPGSGTVGSREGDTIDSNTSKKYKQSAQGSY